VRGPYHSRHQSGFEYRLSTTRLFDDFRTSSHRTTNKRPQQRPSREGDIEHLRRNPTRPKRIKDPGEPPLFPRIFDLTLSAILYRGIETRGMPRRIISLEF